MDPANATDMNPPGIHIALLIAHSPDETADGLRDFAERLSELVRPVLESAGPARWTFHAERPVQLPDDDPRQPSAFLQRASLRMVEGPYDAVVVITDVPLASRRERMVPGLASGPARIAVISTGRLRLSERGDPPLPLDGAEVQWNGATLLLHLLGHLLGLRHTKQDGAVMSAFIFDPERREIPGFNEAHRAALPRLMARFPERDDLDQGTWSEIAFHVTSALRNGRKVLVPVLRSRAPLLPLHLPRLATAALAPTLILVFTAEIWDAGFHMTNVEVWTFACLSVVASATYLLMAQRLFLPREEKRFNTEHLAVVNVGITVTILVAAVGLFAMLMIVMLGIQIFIFPPDLIREWPSLELAYADIGLTDQIRIAALISTIGVLTGALGGGLESRDVVRELALFDADP